MLGFDRALRALFIDHNADDLDVVRRFELFEDLFTVRHLRNRFWRNKTNRVDIFEAGPDERAEVLNLEFPRDLARQSLPGVARTLN